MADALTEVLSVLVGVEAVVINRIAEIADQPMLVALHLAERKGRRRKKVLAAIAQRGLDLELGPITLIAQHMREDIVRAVATMHGSRPTAPRLPTLEPDDIYPAPADEDFTDDATGRGYEFMHAPDIEEIAQGVLSDYASYLEDALDWNITYLWKRAGGKDKTKAKLGACQRVSGLASFFAGDEFLIWVGADNVRDHQLTRRNMDALIFHELCHVGRNENFGPITVPHDVEMFIDEVRIFGPWKGDLRNMVRQLEMPIAAGGQS